jgi:hypothetical protein
MILATLLLFASTSGQEQKSAPDLAVRVDTGEESAQEIPAFDGGGGGTARFKRLKSANAITDQTRVTDLFFKINREGDVVVTHLSVRLANQKEIAIGTYRLRENESATANELTSVGIEPLTLSIVRAKARFIDPSPPIQPLLENKTQAVQIVNFDRDPSRSDKFRLVLRNISTKGIIAVDLFMPSPDGNGGGGQTHTGDRDHLVMAPGGTSEYYISVLRGGRTTPAGYVPEPPIQRTLIIRTLLFEDGSYEGSLETAAEITAQRNGQNLQRKRILELLREVVRSQSEKLSLTVEQFKEQVYSLNNTSDASEIRQLVAKFPSSAEKSLESYLKVGLDDGKQELLRNLSEFENSLNDRRFSLTFAQWLIQKQADYEKRIERF